MEMQKPQVITLETDKLISIPTAAEFLGVHFTTLYRRVKRGELHQIRIGGQTYLDVEQVEQMKNKSAQL